MDEVARRARVSKGTVYNLVGSKEELFLQCVADSMEEARREIARAVDAERDPGRALETLIRGLFLDLLPSLVGERSLRHHGVTAMATSSYLRDALARQVSEFYRQRERETTALLESGRWSGAIRPDVSAREIAIILQAVIDGLVFRATLEPGRVDPRHIARALLGLLGRSDGDEGGGTA